MLIENNVLVLLSNFHSHPRSISLGDGAVFDT